MSETMEMKPRPKLDRMEGHTFIGNWLNQNSTVLDLGMNQGVFAKRIIERYGCRVIGIEANPLLAQQNVHERNLECHNFAVCGKSGTVKFRVDHVNTMNSTIVDDSVDGPDIIEVPAITLLDFIDKTGVGRIDFLKIDIEGAEIDLIDSTPSHIFQKIPQISSEFHAFLDKSQHESALQCIQKLEKARFSSFDFSMNLGNVLFVNSDARVTSKFDGMYFAVSKYFSGARRFITQTHE